MKVRNSIDDSRNVALIQQIEKGKKTRNAIILSNEPVNNLICIQGFRLYYTPADVCKFLLQQADSAHHCLILLSDSSPSFTILLQTNGIKEAANLLERLRQNMTPICSLDKLQYDFIHSFEIESSSLSFVIKRFLDNVFYEQCCSICLNALSSETQIITLECGHTIHSPCVQRMTQWECPMCRYAPLSGITTAVCEVCGSFDRPFVCLSCARSFCYDHALEHYQKEGHAYCASTDGRETWNLMSSTRMQRVALDKSGEYVEMCAKEDVLKGYLESALVEQLAIHREIASHKISMMHEMDDDEISELEKEVAEQERILSQMKNKIENYPKTNARIAIAEKCLSAFKEKLIAAPERIKELMVENRKLEQENEDQAELVKDMEQTLCITAAATLKSKNSTVHIKIGNN